MVSSCFTAELYLHPHCQVFQVKCATVEYFFSSTSLGFLLGNIKGIFLSFAVRNLPMQYGFCFFCAEDIIIPFLYPKAFLENLNCV